MSDLGPLLNCNIKYKVLCKDNILDLIRCWLNARKFLGAIDAKLISRVVIMRHNNRNYRNTRINWDQNPVTFTFQNSWNQGRQISLFNYSKGSAG